MAWRIARGRAWKDATPRTFERPVGYSAPPALFGALGQLLRSRQHDAGPAMQRRFTKFREPIDAASGALDIAEQNPAGIGCDFPEVAWPS